MTSPDALAGVAFRSRLFIPTLKETPAGVQLPSHDFMLRSGMVRQLGSGAYTKLPYGFEIARRLERVVSEEMWRRGAEQLHFPAVQPVSIWKEAERYESYGDDMFSFPDRHGRETCFAPTHEIAAALLGAGDIRRYDQLPVRVYQIQIKYRDEVRPRGGVLRTREFTMHDLYSFDIDETTCLESYRLFFESYVDVFRRVRLPVVPVATSDTGAIGGSVSHEFLSPAAAGEAEFPPDSGVSEDVRGLELAHTFQLGTQYSEKLGGAVNSPDGKPTPLWMCSFGLGIERTIAAVIEHGVEEREHVIWPFEIAPYHVNILEMDSEGANLGASAALGAQCMEGGLRVVIDDRPVRAGGKFVESELLGVRWEAIVGKKFPQLEIRDRLTGENFDVHLDFAASELKRLHDKHPF
ncbi:MAG TPA: aminoacyl--tRNA ligase-related protein [Solirubrobacterales bacterium]|jgi:prolyl-tRNA synthetase|nr:aminoacyl--tRNA ligase-related protein [Solirubrobacterales bacterium]